MVRSSEALLQAQVEHIADRSHLRRRSHSAVQQPSTPEYILSDVERGGHLEVIPQGVVWFVEQDGTSPLNHIRLTALNGFGSKPLIGEDGKPVVGKDGREKLIGVNADHWTKEEVEALAATNAKDQGIAKAEILDEEPWSMKLAETEAGRKYRGWKRDEAQVAAIIERIQAEIADQFKA